MTAKWTKEDYLRWMKDRPEDAADWKWSDCIAADELVKRTTLENFDKYLTTHRDANIKPVLWQFLRDMVRCRFGSVEVDDLLMQLGMYPDWIKPNK